MRGSAGSPGSAPKPCAHETTPGLRSGSAAATTSIVPASELKRTSSPSATPSRARSAGFMYRALVGTRGRTEGRSLQAELIASRSWRTAKSVRIGRVACAAAGLVAGAGELRELLHHLIGREAECVHAGSPGSTSRGSASSIMPRAARCSSAKATGAWRAAIASSSSVVGLERMSSATPKCWSVNPSRRASSHK